MTATYVPYQNTVTLGNVRKVISHPRSSKAGRTKGIVVLPWQTAPGSPRIVNTQSTWKNDRKLHFIFICAWPGEYYTCQLFLSHGLLSKSNAWDFHLVMTGICRNVQATSEDFRTLPKTSADVPKTVWALLKLLKRRQFKRALISLEHKKDTKSLIKAFLD